MKIDFSVFCESLCYDEMCCELGTPSHEPTKEALTPLKASWATLSWLFLFLIRVSRHLIAKKHCLKATVKHNPLYDQDQNVQNSAMAGVLLGFMKASPALQKATGGRNTQLEAFYKSSTKSLALQMQNPSPAFPGPEQ